MDSLSTELNTTDNTMQGVAQGLLYKVSTVIFPLSGHVKSV